MVDDIRIGEARERAARNGRLITYGLLAIAGMVVGFLFGFYEDENANGIAQGTIPNWLAIALAIVTVVALIGGSLIVKRRIDEVERQHSQVAGACAAYAVLVAYPVWYLLWKGQLVPEPSHVVLFLALYAIVSVTYLYRKFR